MLSTLCLYTSIIDGDIGIEEKFLMAKFLILLRDFLHKKQLEF